MVLDWWYNLSIGWNLTIFYVGSFSIAITLLMIMSWRDKRNERKRVRRNTKRDC